METQRTKVANIGWIVVALLLVPLVQVSRAQAQKYVTYRVDGKGLTPPEQYVLAQTEKGEIADLLKQIPDKAIQEQVGKLGLTGYVQQLQEEAREAFLNKYGNRLRIRGKLLETLLMAGFPGYKIHWRGIRINNAFIVKSLDLEGAEVEHEVWLKNSILKGKANFKDSWFKKNLLLAGTEVQGEADFGWVKVGKDFALLPSSFHGAVNFNGADIMGDFYANEAQFLHHEQPANFNSMKVGQTAFFNKAKFQGPVDFGYADVKRNFWAGGAQFLSHEQPANFNTMQVGQTAFFNKAEFRGPVDFGRADIKGSFEVTGSCFLNKEQTANFNNMQVGQSAYFSKVEFQGPVNFAFADFKGALMAGGARFLHQEQLANFDSMKIGDWAFFSEAEFHGLVDFSYAAIKANFEANGAQFLNQGQPADFRVMKVGQTAIFNKAEFQGPVDFGRADISGQFVAIEAKFLNKEQTVSFESMKVGQTAFFDEVTCQGPLDLRSANFQLLQIVNFKPVMVNLEGMTYRNISFGDHWKNTLKLLEKSSPYHAQPYSQLATFFQQSGYPDRADAVFITGKQREWWETWSWEKPWQWPLKILEKIFFDKGVGYGRHPGRVVYFSAFFVILGTWIFSQPGVLTWESRRPLQRIKLKRAFWYSLDAFLPVISLGPDKVYRLSPEGKINWASFIPERISTLFPDHIRVWLTDHHLSATTYFYIHQLAGYVLVSIGVAAMTGIIR
jgi:uncharacterized protein YjbI with pentapeptide repeats